MPGVGLGTRGTVMRKLHAHGSMEPAPVYAGEKDEPVIKHMTSESDKSFTGNKTDL